MVFEGISMCSRNTTSHGDDRSSDYYCGRDPDLSFIHDPANIREHFPGCGLTSDLCSVYSCCSDILEN
jgi:hypothetical protein